MTRRIVVGTIFTRFNYNRVTVAIVRIYDRERLPPASPAIRFLADYENRLPSGPDAHYIRGR